MLKLLYISLISVLYTPWNSMVLWKWMEIFLMHFAEGKVDTILHGLYAFMDHMKP